MPAREPEGVPLNALARWMDDNGLGRGPITNVAVITGGTQNILVRFERHGRSYVLRRPPLHKRPNSDETMRRETRVLSALRTTHVPHPALIASCGDDEMLGAAFYLMEPVDGFNASEGVTDVVAGDYRYQRHMGLAMVDAIARLAQLDVDATGLAGLGRGEGWIGRQVERWRGQLDGYGPLGDDGGTLLPSVDRITAWLTAHEPGLGRVGLMHGDFHFGNVLFHRSEPRIAAVIDWELATVGDPLLDLGHLLATWPRRGRGGLTARPNLPGLPCLEDLITRYVGQTGRDIGDVRWFHVLACFRLAVIIEGSYARAFAGKAPIELGAAAHSGAKALMDQAVDTVVGEPRGASLP